MVHDGFRVSLEGVLGLQQRFSFVVSFQTFLAWYSTNYELEKTEANDSLQSMEKAVLHPFVIQFLTQFKFKPDVEIVRANVIEGQWMRWKSGFISRVHCHGFAHLILFTRSDLIACTLGVLFARRVVTVVAFLA